MAVETVESLQSGLSGYPSIVIDGDPVSTYDNNNILLWISIDQS